MALIYITEPMRTGGVGASGVLILTHALWRAGHTVKSVRFTGTTEDGDSDIPLPLSAEAITATDARELPRPDAWFVSCIFVRQWTALPAMFQRMRLAPLTVDRSPDDPLVAFGGQVTITPEPVARFADIMALETGRGGGGHRPYAGTRRDPHGCSDSVGPRRRGRAAGEARGGCA